jgi:hypothetical protein
MTTTDYAAIARTLTDALQLGLPPIAVCLTHTPPPGVPVFRGRVPAGCVFWQEAARGAFVTSPPLAATPVPPDVVLLLVRPDQALVLAEAAESVDGGLPPAMGRPACAVVPQALHSGRAALSLGCCGARAYLDVMTDDVALHALPGAKLEAYAERVRELAAANATLRAFHARRRRDVEAGGAPTIEESLARLSAGA